MSERGLAFSRLLRFFLAFGLVFLPTGFGGIAYAEETGMESNEAFDASNCDADAALSSDNGNGVNDEKPSAETDENDSEVSPDGEECAVFDEQDIDEGSLGDSSPYEEEYDESWSGDGFSCNLTLGLNQDCPDATKDPSLHSQAETGDEFIRTFAGSTYFETAAMQAEAAFPDSDLAVLVGTGWRDALAGSSLAGALGDGGCPILMTERDSLNPHTSSALEAMGVEHVVVLGGALCVSESVVGELEGEGVSVERIAGEDWRATQMAIYDYGLERGLWSDDTVIVASGDGFRDALSASPVAFSLKAPVFLVKDGEFDESQKSALSLAASEGRFSRPVVLGGPLSVGDQARGFVEGVSRVAQDGVGASVVSLAGDDWAATSAEVASWAVSEGCLSWDGAAFANGAGCHDALAGGPMQGACGSVLLLIEDERSDAVSLVASHSGEVSSIKFLGGHLVMPASVKGAIAESILDTIRYQSYSVSFSDMADWQYDSYSQYYDRPKDDLVRSMSTSSWESDPSLVYQFARIDQGYSGIPSNQLDKIIASDDKGKNGFLSGMGSAFVDASKLYGVNEVYLLSHAIVESGWGTSDLAKGYDYDGKTPINGKLYPSGTYYNFFGIGAYDSSPLSGGRSLAIQMGWNSPYKAILGAARWISENYVHSESDYGSQNTLYLMRWNLRQAEATGEIWHQYATDLSWAESISRVMGQSYAILGLARNQTGLIFEIPLYE